MAKRIKKYGKSALILGLILTLVAMYLAIPIGQAADLTKERDTLSDSRPSVIAMHTVIFKATTAVPLSGHVIVDLPDAFSTPVMDYTDIEIYWDSADPPTTVCTMAASCSATDCCVTVTAELDKVDITLKSGAGILQDDYVKVVIGDGASGGDEDITNPTAGVYTVDLKTQNNVPADIDTGKTLVYIIAGVTVSATVAESLSVSISDSAIGFGTLDSGAIRYATAAEDGSLTEPTANLPTYIEVSTNAASGVGITIKDEGDGSAAGLYRSVFPTKLIPAVGAFDVTAGVEEYGVYGKDAGTGITISDDFDNDSPDVAISRIPQTFATSSGPLDAKNVDISMKASITGATTAGSYADTIILITTPTY